MEPQETNPEITNPTPTDDYDINSMEGYDKPIRNAKILLFVIAGLQICSVFLLPDLPQPAKGIAISINILIGLVFIGLALWTNKKPYWAIITAICFYALMNLLSALVDPATLFQGILLKIIAFVLLIVAIGNAKDVQKWKDSLRK